MTREALLTLIRLHLKRCPGCGYDVSASVDVTCPECGRDLTGDATAVGGIRKMYNHDRWLKAFALSVLPSIGFYVWLVARVESLRRFDHTVPYPTGFLIFTIVLALVVVLIAFGLLRRDPPPRWGVAILVGLAWCATLLMAIPRLE